MASIEELFAAIESEDVEAVRGIVLGDPSLAKARDAGGVSALMRARYRFDRELVAAIMVGEPEMDAFEAATFGDLDRLKHLLDEDPARTSAYSADGFTPLHFSAFFGQTESGRVLLGRGADVDARGLGWMTGTPLNSAASGGHVGVASVLLGAGADPNARQSGGWTPLHSAAHNGNGELVALLLEHGADATAPNDDGTSVLAMAEESGDTDAIARIRDALKS